MACEITHNDKVYNSVEEFIKFLVNNPLEVKNLSSEILTAIKADPITTTSPAPEVVAKVNASKANSVSLKPVTTVPGMENFGIKALPQKPGADVIITNADKTKANSFQLGPKYQFKLSNKVIDILFRPSKLGYSLIELIAYGKVDYPKLVEIIEGMSTSARDAVDEKKATQLQFTFGSWVDDAFRADVDFSDVNNNDEFNKFSKILDNRLDYLIATQKKEYPDKLRNELKELLLAKYSKFHKFTDYRQSKNFDSSKLNDLKIEAYNEFKKSLFKQISAFYLRMNEQGYDVYNLNESGVKSNEQKYVVSQELNAAGEFDMVFINRDTKEVIIVDLKSEIGGKVKIAPKESEIIQTSIYSQAFKEELNRIGNTELKVSDNIVIVRLSLLNDPSNLVKIQETPQTPTVPLSELKKAIGIIENAIKEGIENNAKSIKEYSDKSSRSVVQNNPDSDDNNQMTDSDISELFQTVNEEERLNSPEEIQEQIDYVKQRLGDKIDVKQTSNILFSTIGGRFVYDGIKFSIDIFDKSNYGVGYHETFHGYSQLYLTKEEKKKLYESVKKLNISWKNRSGKTINSKTASYLEIEEFLAEEFKNYVIAKKEGKKYSFADSATKESKEVTSIFQKLLDLINAIYNWFKGTNLNTIEAVNSLYEGLDNNTFNRANFSMDNLMFDFLSQDIELSNGSILPYEIFSRTSTLLDSRIFYDMLVKSSKLSSELIDDKSYLDRSIIGHLFNLLISNNNISQLEKEYIAGIFNNHTLDSIKGIANIKDVDERKKAIAQLEINKDFKDFYIFTSRIQSLRNNYFNKDDKRIVGQKIQNAISSDIDDTESSKNTQHNTSGNEIKIEDMASDVFKDIFGSIPKFKATTLSDSKLIEDFMELKTSEERKVFFDGLLKNNYLQANQYGGVQTYDYSIALNKLKQIISSASGFWDDVLDHNFKKQLFSFETFTAFPEAMYIYHFLSEQVNQFNQLAIDLEAEYKTGDFQHIDFSDKNNPKVHSKLIKYNEFSALTTNFSKLFGLATVPFYENRFTPYKDKLTGKWLTKVAVYEALKQDENRNITGLLYNTFTTVRPSEFNEPSLNAFDLLFEIAKEKSNKKSTAEIVRMLLDKSSYAHPDNNTNQTLFLAKMGNKYLLNRFIKSNEQPIVQENVVHFFVNVLNVHQLSPMRDLITTDAADLTVLQSIFSNMRNFIFLNEEGITTNSGKEQQLQKLFTEDNLKKLNKFKADYERYLQLSDNDKEIALQQFELNADYTSLLKIIFSENPFQDLNREYAESKVSKGLDKASTIMPQFIRLSKLIQKYKPESASAAVIVGENDTENMYHRRSITQIIADLVNYELINNSKTGVVDLRKFDIIEEIQHLDPRKNVVLWKTNPYLKEMFEWDPATQTLTRNINALTNLPINLNYGKLAEARTILIDSLGNELDQEITLAKYLKPSTKKINDLLMLQDVFIPSTRRNESSNAELVLGIKSGPEKFINIIESFKLGDDRNYIPSFPVANRDFSEETKKSYFFNQGFVTYLTNVIEQQVYNYYHHIKYTQNNNSNKKGNFILGLFNEFVINEKGKNTIFDFIKETELIELIKGSNNFEDFYSKFFQNDGIKGTLQYTLIEKIIAELEQESQSLRDDVIELIDSNNDTRPGLRERFDIPTSVENTELFNASSLNRSKLIMSDLMHTLAESDLYFGHYTDFKDVLKRRKLHVNQGDSILSCDLYIQDKLELLTKIESITSLFNNVGVNHKQTSYIVVDDPLRDSDSVQSFKESKSKKIQELGDVLKQISKNEISPDELINYKDAIVDYVKIKKGNENFHDSALEMYRQTNKDVTEFTDAADDFIYNWFLNNWRTLYPYFNIEIANGSTPLYNLDNAKAMMVYTGVWNNNYYLEYLKQRLLAKINFQNYKPTPNEIDFLRKSYAGFNNFKNALTGNVLSTPEAIEKNEVISNSAFVKTAMNPATIEQVLPDGRLSYMKDALLAMYTQGLSFITFPSASKGWSPKTVEKITDIKVDSLPELIANNQIVRSASGFTKNQIAMFDESSDVTFAIQLRSFLMFPLTVYSNTNNKEKYDEARAQLNLIIASLREYLSIVSKSQLKKMGLTYSSKNSWLLGNIEIEDDKKFINFLKDRLQEDDVIDVERLHAIKQIKSTKDILNLDLLTSGYLRDVTTIISGIADEIFRDIRFGGIKAIMSPDEYTTDLKKDNRLKPHKILRNQQVKELQLNGKFKIVTKDIITPAEIRVSWKKEYEVLGQLYIKDKKKNKYVQISSIKQEEKKNGILQYKPTHVVFNNLLNSDTEFYVKEGNKFVQTTIDDALEGIGIRIPLQNMNFLHNFKIAEFLEPSKRDTIHVPQEIYIAIGADNDADSIPLITKRIHHNGKIYYTAFTMVNGEYKLLKSYDQILNESKLANEEFSKINKEINEIANKQINAKYDINQLDEIEVDATEIINILDKIQELFINENINVSLNTIMKNLNFDDEDIETFIYDIDIDSDELIASLTRKADKKENKSFNKLKKHTEFQKYNEQLADQIMQYINYNNTVADLYVDAENIETERKELKKQLKRESKEFQEALAKREKLRLEKTTFKDGIVNVMVHNMADMLNDPILFPYLVKTDSVKDLAYGISKSISNLYTEAIPGISPMIVSKELLTDNITPFRAATLSMDTRTVKINKKRPNLGSFISLQKVIVMASASNLKLAKGSYIIPTRFFDYKGNRKNKERKFNFYFFQDDSKNTGLLAGKANEGVPFVLINEEGKQVNDYLSQITSGHIDVFKEMGLLEQLPFNTSNKNAAIFLAGLGVQDSTLQSFFRNPFIAYAHNKMNNSTLKSLNYKHVIGDLFYTLKTPRNKPQRISDYISFFGKRTDSATNQEVPILPFTDDTKTIPYQMFSDRIDTKNNGQEYISLLAKSLNIQSGEDLINRLNDINRKVVLLIKNMYVDESLSQEKQIRQLSDKLQKITSDELSEVYQRLSDEKERKLIDFLVLHSLELQVTSNDAVSMLMSPMSRENTPLTSLHVKIEDTENILKLKNSRIFQEEGLKNFLENSFLNVFQNEETVNSLLTIGIPDQINEIVEYAYKDLLNDLKGDRETKMKLHFDVLDKMTLSVALNFYKFSDTNEVDDLVKTITNNPNYSFFKNKSLLQAFSNDVNYIVSNKEMQKKVTEQLNALISIDEFINIRRNKSQENTLEQLSDEELQVQNEAFTEEYEEYIKNEIISILGNVGNNFFQKFQEFLNKYDVLVRNIPFLTKLNATKTSGVRFEPKYSFFITQTEGKTTHFINPPVNKMLSFSSDGKDKFIISPQTGFSYRDVGNVNETSDELLARQMFNNLLNIDSSNALNFFRSLFPSNDDLNKLKEIAKDPHMLSEIKTFMTVLAYYGVAQAGTVNNTLGSLIKIIPNHFINKVYETAFNRFSKLSTDAKKAYVSKFVDIFKTNKNYEFFSDTQQNEIVRIINQDTPMEQKKTFIEVKSRVKLNNELWIFELISDEKNTRTIQKNTVNLPQEDQKHINLLLSKGQDKKNLSC